MPHTVFAVFELPDELILPILSCLSPEPRFASYYERFRLQYGMVIDHHHRERMRFLLPLSMTCRTMRFRLRSWIWEHIECPELVTGAVRGNSTSSPKLCSRRRLWQVA